MKLLIGILTITLVIALNCDHKTAHSDFKANGGKLRYSIEDKSTHDTYLVAQFTPRGDLFEKDNLQIYNYALDSEKYPRILISLDHKESNLTKWQGKSFSQSLFAFIPSQQVSPLPVESRITISNVTDKHIEGTFNGWLVSEKTNKRLKIKGEFKAMLKLNI